MKPKRRTFMTTAELAACRRVSLWGALAVTPRANAHLSERMIRYYERNERRIPEPTAARIRQLADIGPVGSIIRASIRKAAPDLPLFRSHKIATQVLADLSAAGLLVGIRQTNS
jgi:hypothetical protein